MDIKKDIDNAITNFLIRIIKEPLSYFSEADLQQLLVEELYKIKVLTKMYPTSVKRGQNSKSVYSTQLLHREYGGGGSSRIDVVVLDKEDVEKINHTNLTIDSKTGYLKPLFAFELGTEKSPDTKKHYENDLKKLKKCKKTGYLIHVHRDVAESKSGTETRNKTEKKIERDFKSAFETPQPDQNIKVLAVLLRVYRKQPKIVGKFELYSQGDWKKINISDKEKMRENILAELS